MRGPRALLCLLLLPLATCPPPPRGREPPGAWARWAPLAAASPGPRAWLAAAEASRASRRALAGSRPGRRDGAETDGAPREDGGRLGSLAQELSGYGRKKGGFRFRFGRR